METCIATCLKTKAQTKQLATELERAKAAHQKELMLAIQTLETEQLFKNKLERFKQIEMN